MVRFFGESPVVEGEAHCMAAVLREDRIVASAANYLAIARTHIQYSEAAMLTTSDELAAIAERYGASPEVMQLALLQEEPALNDPWPIHSPEENS